MANTKIPSELVAINAISGTLIADNAITSVHIAENNITATQIAINAVTALQMADGTITSAKIADGTIVTADIADGQITTGKIADSSVTTAKIAAGTILGADIANNAILTQHIDDNQITADQIADNAVGVDQLAGITRGSVLTGNAAGNPSLLTLGAANTLLQSDGTDLVFAPLQSGIDDNSNAVAITIDSSENVGIGTDSPGQLLHVQNTNNSAFIQVGNNNGSVLYGVNTAGNAFVSGQTSSKDLIFEVNNDEKMRIHNSGKLGIGTDTTTPTGKVTIAYPSGNNAPNTITAASTYLQLGSTDYGPNNDGKFMIGFGYTDGTTNTNSPAYIGFEETSTSGDTKGELTFYTRDVVTDAAPTERMRITDGGNVGIGTNSPQGKFVVSNSGAGGFEFEPDTTSFSVANTNYIASYDRSASAYRDIVVDLGGAESQAVRFKAGGNVGIGTSSPVAKLDIRMSDSNGSYGRGRDGNLNLENTNTSVTEGGWLSISGRMGNTASGGQYQMAYISGGKQTPAGDGDYGGYLTLWTTSGGANGEANSGGYERMRIDSSGRVGIGTNNPSSNLDVRGGSDMGIRIISDADGYSNLQFGDVDDLVRGGISYNNADDSLQLRGYNNATRMRITSNGSTQILHGGTAYYTSFEDNNEINTYTTAGANSTMYLQHPGGDLEIGAGILFVDRTDKRVKIRNSSYAYTNTPVFISNGTEGPSANYDTVVISQNDVPTIRLDETATGQELTLSVGNENSNNAVIGSTGKITLATNRTSGTVGYSVSNGMVVIDTNQVLMNTSAEIKSTDDQILTLNQNDTGGWNYIGFEAQNTRKWYTGMNNNSNFTIGSDVAGATVDVSNANLRAPGIIVQTVRASVENVVGTGDFDILSVNITPKFSDSDIIVHFYTQWSVLTNNGEDWGLQLQRDGTAILGDSQNSYFINGGGVDATDYASQFSTPGYYVRTTSKTDIDTGRSSGTSQITYKIRKVVPANSSTKTVRFGVDGWTGGGVESQRSLNVLIVQEVQPN